MPGDECRPLIPLKETIKNSHQQKKGRKLLLGSRLDAEWFEGSGNLWKCGIAEDGVDQRNFSPLFLLARRHELQSVFSLGKMPITRLPDRLRSRFLVHPIEQDSGYHIFAIPGLGSGIFGPISMIFGQNLVKICVPFSAGDALLKAGPHMHLLASHVPVIVWL